MFRLHIDIPLCEDEEEAAKIAKDIMFDFKFDLYDNPCAKNKGGIVEIIQYRLAKDEDRRVRNYLVKNENGHVSEGKSKIIL